jgi:hypothetical protein
MGVGGYRHAPAALTPGMTPGTHCVEGWVDPRADLDGCGKSRFPLGFDPRTVQPVAPNARIFVKFDIWASLISKKNNGHVTWRLFTFMTSCCIVLRMRNTLNRSCTENQNARFVYNNFSFSKSCRLWDNVEKLSWSREAADDSMAEALCLLDE